MRIIVPEEHMFPREILDEAGLDFGPRASAKIPQLDDTRSDRCQVIGWTPPADRRRVET